MRAKYLILSAAIALAPCAGAADLPTATASDPTDLASLLEGEFTTLPAPLEQPATPVPQPAALYELAKRIDAPAIGHYVVYSELHKGSRDGPIERQAVYSLKPSDDTHKITMTAYTLANPSAVAGAYTNPALASALKPSDLKPMPAGCEMAWHRIDDGFAGDIAPGKCSGAAAPHMIVSKEGMTESKTEIGNSGSSSPEPPNAEKPTFFRRLR